jgi:hypothetical protein
MMVVHPAVWQLIREQFGKSDLEEGAAGAVTVRKEPRGRKEKPITGVTSTALRKKKWRYT